MLTLPNRSTAILACAMLAVVQLNGVLMRVVRAVRRPQPEAAPTAVVGSETRSLSHHHQQAPPPTSEYALFQQLQLLEEEDVVPEKEQPLEKEEEKEEESGPTQICIVTALYGSNASHFDTLAPPPEAFVNETTAGDFAFFVFTNVPDYQPPAGWTPIVTNLTQSRYVTQSRYGKFLAWKEPRFYESCRVIFYHDGPLLVKGTPDRLRRMAQQIVASHDGLMQLPHEHGIRSELNSISYNHKDTSENIRASKDWFKAQPDYEDKIMLYTNCFFGYNPRSVPYQTVSQAFWDVYSLEQQSIRDQPLWGFMLFRHHVAPLHFPYSREELFYKFWKNRGFGGHMYAGK